MKPIRYLPIRHYKLVEYLIDDLRSIEQQLSADNIGILTKLLIPIAHKSRVELESLLDGTKTRVPDKFMIVCYNVIYEFDWLFSDDAYDPNDLLDSYMIGEHKIEVANKQWYEWRVRYKLSSSIKLEEETL